MTLTRPQRNRKKHAVPSDIPGRASGLGQASGGGAGFSSPGLPPGGGMGGPSVQDPRQISVQVPWVVRPPMAREINRDGSGTGYTNANTPAVIPGTLFTMPDNTVGILRSVVLSVNNLLTTSALSWRIRFNGNPVEGWNNLTVFPRNAGSVSVAYGPDETYIFVPEQTNIDVQVVVAATDANTYQAGATYHGWNYPKRVADQFESLYRY